MRTFGTIENWFVSTDNVYGTLWTDQWNYGGVIAGPSTWGTEDLAEGDIVCIAGRNYILGTPTSEWGDPDRE